jgi:hypothetical protein
MASAKGNCDYPEHKTPPLFRNRVSIISSWHHPLIKGFKYVVND